jgi:hypothetical protein
LDRPELAKPVLAVAGLPSGSLADPSPEWYQLRTYTLRTGPQVKMAQDYFEHALIPALNRVNLAPIGAFELNVGPQTPTCYVLIPATSAETLAVLDTRLLRDAEFAEASAAFWNAPSSAPAFMRVEYSLLTALRGWPKLVAPPRRKRIFQLRTYESASHGTHARKVQMLNEAEIAIFTRTGFAPVFFGDTLIGARMPSLTYMLSFADSAELNERWAVFLSDPAWKELSGRPRNADAEIVCNISNLFISPLECSQI